MTMNLEPIIAKYYESFKNKTPNDENNDMDILMDLYDITPELKRKNRQYWGRELGMQWQLLITEIAKSNKPELFEAPKSFGRDEPYDLMFGNDAIDTKYRIGSGDSGTLKKFRQNAKFISEKLGKRPVLLILREDNLPAAITSCRKSGWTIYTKEDTFKYIQDQMDCDIKEEIYKFKDKYSIL